MSFPASDEPDKIYQELAAKWLNGTITPEEKIRFMEWYNDGQDNPVYIDEAFAKNDGTLRKRMLRNIRSGIHSDTPVKTLLPRFSLIAAAVFALALGVGVFYFLQDKKEINKAIAKQPAVRTPAAGTNVELILADGSAVVLDQVKNGLVAQQEGVNILKTATGKIEYQISSDSAVGHHVVYNTLRIPKGARYQLGLPDGTTVWLNSTSSLRFPIKFNGTSRDVELKGEGYFEVAKNKHRPFIVAANKMEVAVLGTHFNIMAYDEEDAVQTTLLEGSVRVSQGTRNALLEPGEQAQWDRKINRLNVATGVNVEKVMAWKNGEFRFENAPVESIMRQIARWYDVRIEYAPHFPQVALTGSISRNNNIQQLLEILEATHRVKFERQGNVIKVEDAK